MKVCTFDTETSIADEIFGPDPRSPKNDFYTIIWGNTPDTIKIKHNEEGFKRELDEAGNDLLSADLIVGQNLPFDMGFIIHHFIESGRLPFVFDLQIAEYLMSGQRHSFASLVELQKIYLGSKVKKDRISVLYKKGIGADKIILARHRCKRLFALYEEYCYDDGKTPLQIFKRQYDRARQLGMLNIIRAYNQYMMALVVIMHTGIKIDVTGVEKTIREFELIVLDKLAQASELVKEYWDNPLLPEFNINSPTHKSALLFGGNISCEYFIDNGFCKNGKPKKKKIKEDVFVKGMGLPLSLTQKSKVGGRYETGKPIISNIIAYTENAGIKRYCELQLEAMNYKKAISTYLKAFLKYQINGYIYPKFNNTAVITGRLSSSGGINWQNQISSGPMAEVIQSKVIAPEGFICVSCDFSQLEMYIAAWNSKDEVLKDDLINGLDFHCQSLAFAEQTTYEDIYYKVKILKLEEYELKRKKAKAGTFQKTYGAGVKSTAANVGLPEELVENMFNSLDAKYWKLKAFNDHVHEVIKLNKKPSMADNIPKSQKGNLKGSRRFNEYGQELLPIMKGDYKYFSKEYIRDVGYYQMPHGKLYSFEEYANITDKGDIRRGFSSPQTKNYTCQGGAADVVGCVTIEVVNYALKHKDEVKVINTVHDSLMFYIKEDKKDLHVPALCSIMENVPKILKKWLQVDLDFKFKVEAKIGKNFGHMVDYGRTE